jgi:hypothetical protein
VKTSDQLCAEIELRLVDGRPALEDPEVAAHLRTCLRCFRTATELREVPQLAAVLRGSRQDDQPDPGELFWARFPKTVADAWERRQVKARVPAWRRLGNLFQLPIPAALTGAAVAAALLLALMPGRQGPGAQVEPADEGSELGPSPAEELELLETDDLRAVAQALRGRSRI